MTNRKSSGGGPSSSTPAQEDLLSDVYPFELVGDDVDPPTEPPEDLVEAWRSFEEGEREDAEELFGAGSWRPAPAIARLFQEANAANPNRDRRSDGIVGDARHAARDSGHNPDARGVVVAGDLDRDGLGMAAAVERARQLAREGKLPQLRYVIYAARITRPDFAGWAEYDGDNPHVTHAHFETFHDPRKADDARPWNLWAASRPPAARPAPRDAQGDLEGRGYDLRGSQGAQGPRVAALQTFLRRRYPLYARQLEADGVWGPRTSAVLREYARRSGVRTADGRNVGPRIARRLHAAGFRG